MTTKEGAGMTEGGRGNDDGGGRGNGGMGRGMTMERADVVCWTLDSRLRGNDGFAAPDAQAAAASIARVSARRAVLGR